MKIFSQQEKIEQKQFERIKEFILEHKLAVIATVNSKGLPEAAVIGFALNEDSMIVFGTYEQSRKYENLTRNSNVALVVGWDKGRTVQIEGTAVEITDPDEIRKCTHTYFAKMPSVAKYVTEKEEKFFKVHADWLRYMDISSDPWEVIELQLAS